MFTRIQRLLDVRPTLDLRELVTIFGCTQLEHPVQQVLRTYKSRLLESLPAADRARADLSRPAFLAAAFLLTAKKHRATVDRAALMAKMGLTRTELAGAMDDVMARCEDQLVTAAAARKRRRGGGDGAGDEDGEDVGPSGEEPGRGGAAGEDGSGGQEAAVTGTAAATNGQRSAKRGRRAAGGRTKVDRNDDEDADGEDGGTAGAADVAVEDLKLVLIGLAPSAGPAAPSPAGALCRKARTKATQRPARKKRHAVCAMEEAEPEGGQGEESRGEDTEAVWQKGGRDVQVAAAVVGG